MPRPSIVHVRIEPDDERVRCADAVFTPSLGNLTVCFDAAPASRITYDLRSVPLNQACRLYDAHERPTAFLICNHWGLVHVRNGPIDPARRYPVLVPKRRPRRVSLVNDVMLSTTLATEAVHPNPDIPLFVRFSREAVKVTLLSGCIPTIEIAVPLRRVGRTAWYRPRDSHGHPLPLRLRRSLLGRMFGVERLDIEWIG